jgi:hypothetical protein
MDPHGADGRPRVRRSPRPADPLRRAEVRRCSDGSWRQGRRATGGPAHIERPCHIKRHLRLEDGAIRRLVEREAAARAIDLERGQTVLATSAGRRGESNRTHRDVDYPPLARPAYDQVNERAGAAGAAVTPLESQVVARESAKGKRPARVVAFSDGTSRVIWTGLALEAYAIAVRLNRRSGGDVVFQAEVESGDGSWDRMGTLGP